VNEPEGSGWILFAGIMILIAGILNIVYGIAAIDDSKFFAGHTEFVVSSLNTWGWIILVIGVLEVLAAFSIWAGGAFGAIFGIFAASLSALGALLSIAAYPFLSLAIFALDVLVIYGLAAYGARGRPMTTTT
jgi:magnesium-transporting ATPase (P-type)